jgi:hypothetical protein
MTPALPLRESFFEIGALLANRELVRILDELAEFFLGGLLFIESGFN